MNEPLLISVELGDRSYPIMIQPRLLDRIGTVLTQMTSGRHIVLVSDDVVEPLYLKKVIQELKPDAARIDSIIVPAGEGSKSIAQCNQIWQKLVELQTNRRSIVIALGGGVIGDLAGFIAASFMRGLDFVQIPTTLLAQVDSSVGGKVGVNLPQAKNLVGAFWQPQSVFIDPNVLTTLDDRNYRAGLAEVFKYGVIMDQALFEFLEDSVPQIQARDPETLTKIIARCCECKAEVVAQDETESTGRRAILNYGHTFGHAIEAVFGYGEYLHGEAIAIGMTCAARLAYQQGIMGDELLIRQTNWLQSIGLPTDCPDDYDQELIAAMKRDKKVSDGTLILILPTRIGAVELVPAPADDIILSCLHA